MDDANCCKAQVELIKYHGEDGVRFCAGGYEALIITSIGANLIELKDTVRGLNLLRTPDDFEIFKGRPQVYGIPVLFPPNRIEDGKFETSTRVYNFPVNEPNDNHNHIHGFLRFQKFEVTKMNVVGQDEVQVEVVFVNNSNSDFYTYFPHDFEFKMLYVLSKLGLEQKVTIINNSKEPMPMGLGFHTALKVPFHPDSKAENYRLLVSVGEEWELSKRMLPTGKIYPLKENDQSYRTEGVIPQGFPISAHYTVKPIDVNGKKFHGAILMDKSKGLELIYEVGESYKHWMLWNETGDRGFVCPEPQTWVVNAPNVNLPHDITGFRQLYPNEVWEEVSRFYVKEI